MHAGDAVPVAEADRPRPGEDGRHVTFCRNCEAFCGLEVDVRDGRAVKILPDWASPHSRGHACMKGTSALSLVYDPDRVLTPLRRTGGPGRFEAVSWESAMADIAQRLSGIIREGGGDAVANYMGNPAAYNIGAQFSIAPFLAHFGIWKKFAASTQDVTSRLAASHYLYGSTYRLPVPDLPRCDLLLILGANPLASHGSILTAPEIRADLDAIAERGRVVVIDPRRTDTAARFEHVPVRPDTDVWLLMAMLNTVLEEGMFDAALLARHTSGLAQLQEAVRPVTAERAAAHCGVPADTIQALAHDFARTERAAIYGRAGLCRGRHATVVNFVLDALNIVAGKFAVPGGWVFGEGPIDLATLRPSALITKTTRFGPQSMVSGYLHFSQLYDEIVEPGEGRVRALLMQSGNIVLSAPGADHTVAALQDLELFVSNDLYMNETNRHAHYILPGDTYFERDDVPLIGLNHMVRPAVQYTAAVLNRRGECRNEADVYEELARRMHELLSEDPGKSGYVAANAPRFDAMAVVDDLLRTSGTEIVIDGEAHALSLDLLKAHPHGLQISESLHCVDSWSKVVHADGLVHLWDDELAPEFVRVLASPPPGVSELRLFGLRRYQTLNSWMHNIDRLVRAHRPLLMMHPSDATARAVADGDEVVVSTAAGSIKVIAKVTEDVVPGSVCYPHGCGHHGGWQRANAAGGANVNVLADRLAGDRLSASAHLDGIAVEVRPA